MAKTTSMRYKNADADNTGLSLFDYRLLPPISSKSREILRKLELTAVQGHWFVSIESECRICNFISH